jgi:hypothetical protein
MNKRIDWKFLVVLIATVAGVLVPVWLWRADLTSRAMHFRVGSIVSLQPQGQAALDGLALTIDDVKIDSPYLTVLEMHNDGSRPVPASEFEGPIQILAAPPTKIVRARLVKSTPKDLPLRLKIEGEQISIQPLLLNPGDTFEIAVLTSGPAPTFRPMARIAGIRDLPMITDADETPRYRYLLSGILLLTALIAALPAGMLIWNGFSKNVTLLPRAALLIALVTGSTAALLVQNALKLVGLEGFWPYLGGSLALLAVATPLGLSLNTIRRIEAHRP